nr:YceI family protein [Streptomyces scabichelini]
MDGSISDHTSSDTIQGRDRGVFSTFSGLGQVLTEGSAHGTLTIDAASVDTRVAKRDEHLRGADFFHVADHPSIVFAATRVAPSGRATAQVTGELSVLGRTRPVSFTAHATEASADAVTLTAELGIARKDFGKTWNRLGIMKDITIVTITARFTRSAP